MFYINTFIRLYKTHFWSFFIGPILLVAISFLVSNPDFVSAKVKNILPNGDFSSSFHALIDSKINHERVARKIRNLPGINKVEVIEKKILDRELVDFQNDLGVQKDGVEQGYNGIVVVLSETLKPKAVNLVREYLLRLVGKDNIVLGDVISPDDNMKESRRVLGQLPFASRMVLLAFISLLFIFVVVKNWRLIKQEAYLAEQYQRRSMMGLKFYFVGIFPLSFLLLVVLFLTSFVSVLSFIYMIIIILVGSIPGWKKSKWVLN